MEGVKLFPHDEQTVRSWKPSIFAIRELTFEKIFENRVHAFVDDILNNRTPYPTGLDGLKALQVVQGAIDSFEQKKTVRLVKREV